MKIVHFVHTGVSPTGDLPGGGNVEIAGRVQQSAESGGCGNEGCACSAGHWLSKVHPRTEDGVVFGYTAYFNSRDELLTADLALIEAEARKRLN